MTRTLDRKHRHAMRLDSVRQELSNADAVHIEGSQRLLRGRPIESLVERDLMHLLNYLHNANQR